jgi:hypothetical protein
LEALCKRRKVKRKWGFHGQGFKFDRSESALFKQKRKPKIAADNESDEQSEGEAVGSSTTEGIKQRKDGKLIAE